MSRVRTPENIEIASLKKKQQVVFDPMTHGTGTPWEDRGTHGTLGAFFKTAFGSLFGVGKIMNSIRRPETTTDAKGFLVGNCIIWALSGLMHAAIIIYMAIKKMPDVAPDTTVMVVDCVLATAAGGAGAFFLFKIYNAIYGRLVAQEKGAGLMPDVLLYNVNVYALGPSFLALIPFAGPIIAAIWIFADLVTAGTSRLRLRPAAALIDALLSFAAVMGIAVVSYLIVGPLILHRVMGYDVVTPLPTSSLKPHTYK